MSDDVKVGNFNEPSKRPTPKSATAPAEVEETTAVREGGDGIAELNAKMDKLLEFAQAIDWKMWVYLKANNYID
jgi:hypothetical protein